MNGLLIGWKLLELYRIRWIRHDIKLLRDGH